MDLKSGYPYSLVRNGIPFDYPLLTKNLKTSVAIIGGGISGALMAYNLTKAGIDCAVLDRRTIGLGSSVASTSLLQYEIDTPLNELIQKIGRKNAIRAYQLCGDSINTLSGISRKIGFEHFTYRKSLYYAAAPKDVAMLRDELLARREAGFEVDLLGSREIKKLYGFGSEAALLSGLAAQTDAYLMSHALHQHNLHFGALVFDRTEISNFDHRRKSVVMKTDRGHTITARYVVFANGYEGQNYIEKKIVSLQSTYATVSGQRDNEDPVWYEDSLIWNTGKPYLYLRMTSDNRILIGGRDEHSYNPSKRDALVTRKATLLARDFRKLYPEIAFKPEFSWAGTFGSTPDSLPYIGEYPGRSNGFFALGYGGNGITFSVIAAEMITSIIKGKKHRDLELFSFNRKSL